MARALIPLRPKSSIVSLAPGEQAALTWYVLSGCTKKEAFITFARPDMLDSKAKAAIDDYVKQFYAKKECIEYIRDYEKTLDEFLHPVLPKVETSSSIEERKAKAKTKLVEFAMDLADNIENASDPETVLKLADKVGLLDGDEEVVEAPRRYLPVSCSECEYKKFIEENCEIVENGTEVA